VFRSHSNYVKGRPEAAEIPWVGCGYSESVESRQPIVTWGYQSSSQKNNRGLFFEDSSWWRGTERLDHLIGQNQHFETIPSTRIVEYERVCNNHRFIDDLRESAVTFAHSVQSKAVFSLLVWNQTLQI